MKPQLSMHLLFFLSLICWLRRVEGVQSDNGTSTTTFVTLGEGITYDGKRDRFILGSLVDGTLLAVPHSTVPQRNVNYGVNDVTMILSTRPEAFNGSNFLGLTMDPQNEDAMWGCVAYGEYKTYGVARINLTTNDVIFHDLSHLANDDTGGKAVLNDLAFSPDGQYLFITDTWGYQIIRFTVSTGAAEIWNNGTIFCTACLTVEPHFDGPNGIVYVSNQGVGEDACLNGSFHTNFDDYLVIGLGSSSNRLLRVNVTYPFQSPADIVVHESAGVLSQMDGLVMAFGDISTLFVVGNGVNSIFALTSEDNWITAMLRSTFNANCPQYQPSAATLVNNKDLICYCTNGFGEAPYPLSRLANASARVISEVAILYESLGDSIEYHMQRDRIVVSSKTSGSIVGFANTEMFGVGVSKLATYPYFAGGGIFTINSTEGLKIDSTNSCWLWAAVSSTPIGVAMIDLCLAYQATEPDLFIDLTSYMNPEYGSSPCDITVVDETLYVTDVQGGYIWEIAVGSDLNNIAVEIFLAFDPAIERPNSIETKDGILLINFLNSNLLKRYDIYSKAEMSVILLPNQSYSNVHYVRFDNSKDVLYAGRNTNGSVLALISCDEWYSAQVVTNFLTTCAHPTSLTMTNADLYILCFESTWSGYSTLSRIKDTSSKVFSGETACRESDGTYSDSNGGSNVKENPFFWVSLALSILMLFTVLIFSCSRKIHVCQATNNCEVSQKPLLAVD